VIDTNSISFAPASAANVCAEIIFVVEAGHIVATGQRVKMKLIITIFPRKRPLCTTPPF
jgi:hypothetical protein